jgi:hypothetical protein
MTTILPAPTTAVRRTSSAGQGRVSLLRVVHSEWIKMYSLPSTVITLLAAVITIVGLGALFAASYTGAITGPGGEPGGPGPGAAMTDSVGASLGATTLGALLVGVLGVLLVTGEYATGMIRSTLAAVPARLPVLVGKAVVFAAAAGVAMLVAMFTAFYTGTAVIGTEALALSDDGVLRAVLGAAVYVVGVGLIGMGIGWILRNTGASIAALLGLLLLVPGLLQLLEQDWQDAISPYLPSNLGTSLMSTTSPETLLDPAAALAWLTVYALGVLGVGAVLLKTRDA